MAPPGGGSQWPGSCGHAIPKAPFPSLSPQSSSHPTFRHSMPPASRAGGSADRHRGSLKHPCPQVPGQADQRQHPSAAHHPVHHAGACKPGRGALALRRRRPPPSPERAPLLEESTILSHHPFFGTLQKCSPGSLLPCWAALSRQRAPRRRQCQWAIRTRSCRRPLTRISCASSSRRALRRCRRCGPAPTSTPPPCPASRW